MVDDYGYIGICYHYIECSFPGISGVSINNFREHIKMLSTKYQVISPEEALQFSYGDFYLRDRYGILFTFDDGLSDQYLAACILAENNIKAFFFIPTCIFKDGTPANPTILHYCLARYGITKFRKFGKTESEIKGTFKYILPYKESRAILLDIYKKYLYKKYSNILEMMHLTVKQINEMLSMGHIIGTHTHSHISVTRNDLTDADFREEMIEPKKYLEQIFNVPINTFSYPFGEDMDCFSSESLEDRTNAYQLVFTIEKIINKKTTSPLELGRYQVANEDNVCNLNKNIEVIK